MSNCEIAEKYSPNNAMRLVFNYLNKRELQNAILVSKSWCEIGKSLVKKKLYKTIIGKQEEKYQSLVTAIKNAVRYLVKNPSFCMFTINDFLKFNDSESCYCELSQSSCYFIVLRIVTQKNERFKLTSTIFPYIPDMQITHYTFYTSIVNDEFYCPEICSSFDNNFLECHYLKYYFNPLFRTECASKCLIVWCKKSSIKNLTNLVKNMAEWYPANKVVVWGGVAETITVCNKNVYLGKCRKNVDFSLCFINDPNVEVKSLFLDQNYTDTKLLEEKFIALSERTKLKKHFIAFMYTSDFSLSQFFALKSFLVKKYFPSVKLVHIVGREPLGGTGFVDLFRRLDNPLLEKNNIHTALIILAYD